MSDGWNEVRGHQRFHYVEPKSWLTFSPGDYVTAQISTERNYRVCVIREITKDLTGFSTIFRMIDIYDGKEISLRITEESLKRNLGNLPIRKIDSEIDFNEVSRSSAKAIFNFSDIRDSAKKASEAMEKVAQARWMHPDGYTGWFVKYSIKKNSEARVNIVSATDMSGWEEQNGDAKYEKVDSLEDAWIFIDYLTDDDVGKPIAICENKQLVVKYSGRGWITHRHDGLIPEGMQDTVIDGAASKETMLEELLENYRRRGY